MFVPVAQLVEHLTFNQRVQDSSSCGRTKTSHFGVRFFVLSRRPFRPGADVEVKTFLYSCLARLGGPSLLH